MSSQIGAIVSVNALIGRVLKHPKGDLADRLNSTITVCILALTAGFLMSTHIWGEPITCWTPAQFTKGWTDFVNQYCYIHGTYFVPLDEELDFNAAERRRFTITYYQWVPYVLAVQAVLYYMPRLMWRYLCAMSGFDLVGAIRSTEQLWDDVRRNEDKFKGRLASFEQQSAVYIWDGIHLGRRKRLHHLTLYYVVFTAVQTLNAWLQFIWLNESLQSVTYSFWGPSIIMDLYRGVDWQTSGHFPRITHCDFSRRRPASVQNRTSVEHFLRLLGKDGLFIVQQISINVGDLPTRLLFLSNTILRFCNNECLR
ncbi:unnamed protein product [Anisakis simplex]|uniref:Innexin n=1 Tax=Anisakis simplex TaxID=6269 RepID=A0A0M3JSM7_ANISI|nr:unnamed protein product [Anisakis simplex]